MTILIYNPQFKFRNYIKYMSLFDNSTENKQMSKTPSIFLRIASSYSKRLIKGIVTMDKTVEIAMIRDANKASPL